VSEKQCPKCKRYFKLEAFGKDPRCKICCRAKSKKYRKDNPKRVAESNKKSRKANPQSINRSLRKARLKRYGLTEKAYTNLFVEQGGVCAVCKQSDSKALTIDHCHNTGIIRGLLCSACNKAEGLLKSDSNIIRALADYVEYHKGEKL
jgi:hypothetical protein